jgi:hypothetical protein
LSSVVVESGNCAHDVAVRRFLPAFEGDILVTH